MFNDLGNPVANMLQSMMMGRGDKHFENSVEDIDISTIETPDHGWETAVKPPNTNIFYPVHRHDSEANAEIAHYQWCEKAKTMTEFTMLGSELYDMTDQLIKITR